MMEILALGILPGLRHDLVAYDAEVEHCFPVTITCNYQNLFVPKAVC